MMQHPQGEDMIEVNFGLEIPDIASLEFHFRSNFCASFFPFEIDEATKV